MQAHRQALRTPITTRIAAVALISLGALALNVIPRTADAAAAGQAIGAPTMHQGIDRTHADDTPIEAGASIAAYGV